MNFDTAFQHVILVEGGYSNNPLDSGGRTKYGITERVARANGYEGDMKDLPLETAKRIYKAQYWDILRLDDVCALSYPVAAELFDTAVNMGVGIAGRFLQRALNVLNRNESDYGDMTVDGIVGPVTVHDLGRLIARRGQAGIAVLLKALNIEQGYRYIEIAEGAPKNESFIFGWLSQRIT